MEKISGILPSNSRIKSVDMKGAHPQRPGTPNFGQKMGSTSQDRISMSERATDLALQETLAGYNPREARHAKIAEDMSKNFFQSRVQPELRESEATGPGRVSESKESAPFYPVAVSSSARLAAKEEAAKEASVSTALDEPVSSLDLYA